jgi:hypothetical protein
VLQKERPLKIRNRKPKDNSQRQEELRRIDAWRDRLHRKHPVLHWLLAIGIAVGVLAIAMLLKWLFTLVLPEREVVMSRDAFKQSGSSPTKRPEVDVVVENHFSLLLFRLLSPSAKSWVDQNVQEDAQFFGGALVVEPRYARNLIQGMRESGLGVRS